jgi:hypothetical protein
LRLREFFKHNAEMTSLDVAMSAIALTLGVPANAGIRRGDGGGMAARPWTVIS